METLREDGGALRKLLEEADGLGISPDEILSCFSEWRRFGYWRFDGENIFLAGNFPDIQETEPAADAEGQALFVPRIDPQVRAEIHGEIHRAFAEGRGMTATYEVDFDHGQTRRFRSVAKYREHDDGSRDMFGIAYEGFTPGRMISLPDDET